MRCRQVRKKLTAFLDAEISGTLQEHVGSHLQVCPRCGAAWARLQLLHRTLHANSAPSVPDDFVRRVLAQMSLLPVLSEPRVGGGRLSLRWQTFVSVVRYAAAAALLVIGVTGGLVLGVQMRQRAEPLRPTEESAAVYNLDYLGSTPDGSLPHAYLTLVSASQQPGGK
jgi:anti-sigma factor RsiW